MNKWIFLFVFLVLPVSAFADISTQYFGTGGSFSTTGTVVETCDGVYYTYLRSDPNETNFEQTSGCLYTDLTGYEAKNFFYVVENSSNISSSNFYWCIADYEYFTLSSDGTTDCPSATTATTTFATSTATLQDVVFGLGIIITIMSIALVAFVFNSIKKPWH